jgi:ankyrin repeat protein
MTEVHRQSAIANRPWGIALRERGGTSVFYLFLLLLWTCVNLAGLAFPDRVVGTVYWIFLACVSWLVLAPVVDRVIGAVGGVLRRCGWASIASGIRNGDFAFVSKQVERIPDLAALGAKPGDWLSLAVQLNAREMVELLLRRGVSAAARNRRGAAPWHAAHMNPDPAVLELLLDHGAPCDATDMDGRTPLHLAASEGYPHALSLLLQRGASCHAVDAKGRTPLHDVRTVEYVALLVKAGADPNARDHAGDTPLHRLAAQVRYDDIATRIAEALIAHGADPLRRNAKGQVPGDLVSRKKARNLAALLAAQKSGPGGQTVNPHSAKD